MDIMLDLETLGNAAGCIVLSIGAVPFNAETGDVHSTGFYADLDIQSQLDQGLKVGASTLLWWFQQADIPRLHQAKVERQHPGIVLDNFRDWYKAVKGTTIWGHGVSFDPPILEALYRAYGMGAPWKYNIVRDTRTVFALIDKKMGDFGTVNSVAHDALSDALFQARETVKCLAAMRKVFLHGKERLAELAAHDAELERQRQARNGDVGAGQSDAQAGNGRDANDAADEAGDRARDGANAGDEGEANKTFIRPLDAERAPTPEARRSESQLYGHDNIKYWPETNAGA